MVPAARGVYNDALIPDTLDLAARAGLWISMATQFLREDADYEPLDLARFDLEPARASLCGNSVICAFPKFSESLPLMRLMSGSRQNLIVDQRWLSVSCTVSPDGLYYIPVVGRPWTRSLFMDHS